MKSQRIISFAVIFMLSFLTLHVSSPNALVKADNIIEEVKPEVLVQLKPLNVPPINSSFKTYMDYRTITNQTSAQYKLIKEWSWCDDNGFLRVYGEKEFGIDDYYVVALGSYYGSCMGTKYKFTTDTGNVFYGILGDQKSDRHTNSSHQYSFNNDVVEFIVDTKKLNKTVKKMGSANVYMPLNGSIINIEQVEFI